MGVRSFPVFAPYLAAALREGLERAVVGIQPPRPLWLSKGRLAAFARCPGLFASWLAGEQPPFEHSLRTAAGTLFHRCIEIHVGVRLDRPAAVVAGRAAAGLQDDPVFAAFWSGLDRVARAGLHQEAARRLELFRDTFPPFPREWGVIPERPLRADLAGGAVVLAGRVDLVMGTPDRSDPSAATRLAIDLKSGDARPEHAEDMRFYALLMALRLGVPPYRVATFFLDSGEWQAEDVTEDVLHHAVDRTAAALAGARRLLAGVEPELRPGPHCGWCPRRSTCPAFAAVAAGCRPPGC
jgi:RecB family exonuclease